MDKVTGRQEPETAYYGILAYEFIRLLIAYFNKTIRIPDYIASSGRAKTGNEWKGMWKEAVVSS
jgi:hypothetical protein